MIIKSNTVSTAIGSYADRAPLIHIMLNIHLVRKIINLRSPSKVAVAITAKKVF